MGRQRGSGKEAGGQDPPANEQSEGRYYSAYAFYLAAIALLLVSIVFLIMVNIYKTSFDAATVTTALSSLFTLVGTVVGAYFGIKVSTEVASKSQAAQEEAQATTQDALAALPKDQAETVLEKARRRRRS